MSRAPEEQRQDARQLRLASLVMAGAMLLWIALQWLASRQGWQTSYALLIDFAAIAAFVWSLIVTFRVWQRRRQG